MQAPSGPNLANQAKARSALALMGVPAHPADDAKLTLRQLVDWRHTTVDAMDAAVERDMFPPRRAGLFGGGATIGAREAGQRDWAAVGAVTLASTALLGAAIAHGVVNHDWSTLVTVPAGVAVGLGAMDLLGTTTHAITDELFLRPHVPGEASTAGTDGWVHHFKPWSVPQTHWIRTAGAPALGGAIVAGLALAADAFFGLGPFAEAAVAALGIGVPLWLLGHRATHRRDDQGAIAKAAQDIGFFDTSAHHGVHHGGDTSELLPGEPALRHVQAYASGFGKLGPARWLDGMGVFQTLVRWGGRLIGREPLSYREHPAWKHYWTAPDAEKPKAKLEARIAAFIEEREAVAYDRAVAKRSAAGAQGDEQVEAATYAAELDKHIATMDAGIAELKRRHAALVA